MEVLFINLLTPIPHCVVIIKWVQGLDKHMKGGLIIKHVIIILDYCFLHLDFTLDLKINSSSWFKVNY